MNVYVWQYVEFATNNYHPEGGVVCVAESLEAARSAIAEATPREVWESGKGTTIHPSKCEALTAPPDHVWAVVGAEPCVLVFPDSGCC